MIAIAAKAAAWFGARSLLAKLATYAVVALALWGGYAAWKHSIYRAGYDAAIADVAEQNQEAADAVAKALDRVRACRNSGGVWNQSVRQCDRSVRE